MCEEKKEKQEEEDDVGNIRTGTYHCNLTHRLLSFFGFIEVFAITWY
jgi:hypothetical protein